MHTFRVSKTSTFSHWQAFLPWKFSATFHPTICLNYYCFQLWSTFHTERLLLVANFLKSDGKCFLLSQEKILVYVSNLTKEALRNENIFWPRR